MTLHVFVKCKDGSLIISDRKEKYGPTTNNVSKWIVSSNDDVFVTIAGNGNLPKILLSRLKSSSITHSSVESEIHSITKSYIDEGGFVEAEPLKGFLVRKIDSVFTVSIFELLGKNIIISENSSDFFSIGTASGKILIDHFLQNRRFPEITCDDAAKIVMASMDDVAKSVNDIGNLDVGYDITKFSNDNISQRLKFTDSNLFSFRIEIDFGKKPIFEMNQQNGADEHV